MIAGLQYGERLQDREGEGFKCVFSGGHMDSRDVMFWACMGDHITFDFLGQV